MKHTKIALAASLMTIASLASAGDIEYGVQLGNASGGDNIIDDLDAGDGRQVGVYALLPLSMQGVSVKIAANYIKHDSSFEDDDNNMNIEFTRIPIDVLLVKQLEKLRLAAGVTYHTNIKYKFTDNIDPEESDTTNADNALGLIIEANYQIYSNESLAMDLGLRYTNIEYNFKDQDSTSFDASSVAFVAGLSF